VLEGHRDVELVAEPLAELSQGVEQAQIVQRRWPKLQREAANALQRLHGHPLQVLRQPERHAGRRFPDGRDGEELGKQELGGLVVQLPGKAFALLLLGMDDLRRQRLDLTAVAGNLVKGGIERFGEMPDLRIGKRRWFRPRGEIAQADGGRGSLQDVDWAKRRSKDEVVHDHAQRETDHDEAENQGR